MMASAHYSTVPNNTARNELLRRPHRGRPPLRQITWLDTSFPIRVAAFRAISCFDFLQYSWLRRSAPAASYQAQPFSLSHRHDVRTIAFGGGCAIVAPAIH